MLVSWFLPAFLALLVGWIVLLSIGWLAKQSKYASRNVIVLSGIVAVSVAIFTLAALLYLELPRPPTQYAADYNRLAFIQIRSMDSEERVKHLVGEPLPLEWVPSHILHYTWPKSGRGGHAYVRRVVVLCPDSRMVIRTISDVQP